MECQRTEKNLYSYSYLNIMADDLTHVTRVEFDKYRSLVRQVCNSKDLFALFGLTTVMGPIVTAVVSLDKHSPDNLVYGGVALSLIAGYKAITCAREYRILQRELATLESHYV